MRKKIGILKRTAFKGARKILKGNTHYKGRPISYYVASSFRQIIENGPGDFARKVKKEILDIDRLRGGNLSFPNGLVSGVNRNDIKNWYDTDWRHVTIIIPSYNDEEYLTGCIESLKKTTNPEKVSVIIVDDYCKPESKVYLEKLKDEQISIVYRQKNGGFAKAVNAGIKAANNKDDIILLNSDTIAHAGWLEALQYGAHEFDPEVAIVGSKLLYEDGRIQSAGTHRNTENKEYFDHYYRFQEENYGPANVPHYCLAVTGACMYVKRQLINYIGLLDEKFDFAFEDVDWCLRGWEAGFKTLYFPASTLTHLESVTRPKNKQISEKESNSINYFWKKWKSWFDDRNVKTKDGRIRIIFVLQSFGLSGGIKNVFEQANRLAERGFSVEIWGLDKKEPAWPVSKDVRIKTFKNYERLTTALTPIEAIKVATWWETAFPVWLGSVIKGRPVYFIQEFESWFYPDDIVSQSVVVSCYRKEFNNITISSYNLDELKNIGLDAKILPCGYDDSIYKPMSGITRRKDILLAVGRTFFQKNLKMTIDGWKLLGEDRPKMWLYGAEPSIAKKDSRIEYFKRPSNEEVNKLFNESTVFVQTSRHEGFCLPVLEAMAAGCPVICTDSHGNRDFCFDKKNCIMVDHDDTAGLKEAILTVMTDEKLRKRLSVAGIRTANQYKWAKVMDLSEELYKSLAK